MVGGWAVEDLVRGWSGASGTAKAGTSDWHASHDGSDAEALIRIPATEAAGCTKGQAFAWPSLFMLAC